MQFQGPETFNQALWNLLEQKLYLGRSLIINELFIIKNDLNNLKSKLCSKGV